MLWTTAIYWCIKLQHILYEKFFVLKRGALHLFIYCKQLQEFCKRSVPVRLQGLLFVQFFIRRVQEMEHSISSAIIKGFFSEFMSCFHVFHLKSALFWTENVKFTDVICNFVIQTCKSYINNKNIPFYLFYGVNFSKCALFITFENQVKFFDLNYYIFRHL